jgi:predicted membrane-bound mannosyltransferase
MRLTVLTPPRLAIRLAHRLALGELTLAAGLFALALALRLPQLLVSPHYTDETRDVLWGWDIYRGLHLPLTSWDAYKGPFFPYLMAALFKILGPDLLWPA